MIVCVCLSIENFGSLSMSVPSYFVCVNVHSFIHSANRTVLAVLVDISHVVLLEDVLFLVHNNKKS
jgi:hypothetical protein